MNKDIKAGIIAVIIVAIFYASFYIPSISDAIWISAQIFAVVVLVTIAVGYSWMAWNRIRWIWYRLKTYFNILF